MPTRVRSFSKINLGLAIGPPRPDGFHSLSTLYQTVALHDLLTVQARPAPKTRISLSANDPRVPTDGRNTVWKIVERTLTELALGAEVTVTLQKNLPIQGGMGAGSANAAAALLGLERELGLNLPLTQKLALAAHVGSDVPLFLLGGSVLGSDRGQVVERAPEVTLDGVSQIPCVIALPATGVSTPQAFRDWDARLAGAGDTVSLQNPENEGTLEKLSRIFASVLKDQTRSGTPESPSGSREPASYDPAHNQPDSSAAKETPGESSLETLVRLGIANDFETVVFPQYPALAEIKQVLLGDPITDGAVYAALSGSGSALFGLYRSQGDALAAQQRLQRRNVQAIVTATLPRSLYWSNMFAE